MYLKLQVENPTHATAHAPEKNFQQKLRFFQLLQFDNQVKEKKYKLPGQNKLYKTACLKMQFMSRVFSNTTSLMTSVCMLYVGAMAASSYLS